MNITLSTSADTAWLEIATGHVAATEHAGEPPCSDVQNDSGLIEKYARARKNRCEHKAGAVNRKCQQLVPG
ncbi:uncharacterized protein CANTADRAFT_91047 [Suhomyces tanzawaensis NRRL Y-17324]|uniref:Uncharacterized protein n=1 Tax=Suhomyces tanzawaensis NRRL Y-17324 TaxID=984487 RepID=A0A1E4SGZ5_9ASCO|nr:uncharacterized protein CANTADRAFT_91047 [Suhomyces tanzawaensis NRRL Y-17324]ODV78757.1 hypothetical protein CANTADRAFT_91047 [Suhomyces tanzawaensis NRRL Y-17324]